ncbi:hypothetical protein ACS0TY_032657 [Phlomoides rotata]
MRLLWFTVGFASTSGAIAQFVFKDLYTDRNSISSQLKEKFNSLDTRVSNLESAITNQPISTQQYMTSLQKPFQRLLRVWKLGMALVRV